MLVSVEDSCMVYAKRAIGSEILLDAANGTPSDKAQVEARLAQSFLTQDSCSVCPEHAIGSEIILDAPD
jgi:hypothetical protein